MIKAVLVVLTMFGGLVPSTWVLRARVSHVSIYVDSSRVERGRPDTTTGFWLLWVQDTPQPADTVPNAARYKQIEMHVGIRCGARTIHPYEIAIYDSIGRQITEHSFTPTDPIRRTYSQMAANVAHAVCQWFRDSTAPPVIVPDPS